ncbi:MAG: hypothetical protein GF331_19000, partial [Chitinivibrionales bacterium]|nr:hypothetical protein [Chitinivibrionales bacterium]
MNQFVRGAVCVVFVACVCLHAQDQAYRMTDNFVVVEAEDLPYSADYWSFQDGPSGYTGSGWLLNTRDDAQGGDACHQEATHEGCLTPEAGWLKIPVYIDEVQGAYGGVFS